VRFFVPNTATEKQQILELPLKLLSTIECLNYICKFSDMSLSLENKKIELIQWLSTLNDTSLIDKLMKLREKEKNDWWNEISENEKISIEKGIQDADNGKLTSHSNVKEIYEKWL
tara:strand:+ start:1836 stop:2180 length:345 start_codon:yes stop_codon:yes gene_type:complete